MSTLISIARILIGLNFRDGSDCGFCCCWHFSCWRQKMASDILFLFVTTLFCSSNLIGESTAQELRKYRPIFLWANKHCLQMSGVFFKLQNIYVIIRLKVQLFNSLSILKWSIPILQAFSEKKNQNFFFQYNMQKIEKTTSSFIWPIKNTWFLLAASHNWLHFRFADYIITCIKSVNCPNPSYTRITDKK